VHHKLVIALYLRLSKEDDPTEDESNSITSQRLLLERFAAENFTDYELIEYADDGYSGTNMNRPGMNALLKAAEGGQLDLVIVKDFSRFSRDYIELGTYMEQIFPFLHIRFISVGDHYDSRDMQGTTAELNTNFRSLLYDFYSKDLSVKVKSALTAKKENGEYACANTPFGYRKVATDRHKLLVVPREAEIIRRIFNLAANGMTSMEIALLLNKERVKTPIQFKIEAGETKRDPKGNHFHWSGQGICRILENTFYIGEMVYGKYEQQVVGGRKVLKPKSRWLSYPEHHPAIVDRKQFEQVQMGRGKRRPQQVREKHPLTSRVICGTCNKKMRIRYGRNPYFTCTDRYVTGNETCVTKLNIRWLEELLCFIWNREWSIWGNQKDAVEYYRKKVQEEKQKKEKMAENLHARLNLLQTSQKDAYEKYVLGGRENPGFLVERKAYQSDIQSLLEKIQEVEGCLLGDTKEISHILHSRSDDTEKMRYNGNSSRFAENINIDFLSRDMTDRFLVSITMRGTNRIEICWNFNQLFTAYN
jgi:DNA invertase Pin-like site-specific DNA recombinase/ssDNA-binding Zn-finger/Zn-ribbon topoisomerase 1